MTIYHPNAKIEPTVEHFDQYGRNEDPEDPNVVDLDPTSEFGSRVEFEFAELVLEAALNRKQITRLLNIVNKIKDGAEFRFSKHTDIESAWKRASARYTPVSNSLTGINVC